MSYKWLMLGMFFIVNTAWGNSRDLSPIIDEFNKEDKIAIVIGINKYSPESNMGRLKFAVSDAKQTEKNFKRLGYTVISLFDEQATRSHIKEAIRKSGNQLKSGGTLVFYYAGHGFSGGTNKNNYLITHGTVQSNLAGTSLALKDVREMIKATGARQKMLFLDACRNDPLRDGARSAKGQTRSFQYENDGEGLLILYSTQVGGVSWESNRLRYGIFSYYLNRGLLGFASEPSQPGLVTFRSLAGYVTKNVENHTLENRYGHPQRPRITGEEFTPGRFILSLSGQATNSSSQKKVVNQVAAGANTLPTTPVISRPTIPISTPAPITQPLTPATFESIPNPQQGGDLIDRAVTIRTEGDKLAKRIYEGVPKIVRADLCTFGQPKIIPNADGTYNISIEPACAFGDEKYYQAWRNLGASRVHQGTHIAFPDNIEIALKAAPYMEWLNYAYLVVCLGDKKPNQSGSVCAFNTILTQKRDEFNTFELQYLHYAVEFKNIKQSSLKGIRNFNHDIVFNKHYCSQSRSSYKDNTTACLYKK